MDSQSKRVALAVALSALVFVAYNFLFPPPKEAPRPAAQSNASTPTPAPAVSAPAPSAAPSTLAATPAAAGLPLTVRTPLYEAKLNSQGGVLQSLTLRHFKDHLGANAAPINLVTPTAAARAPLGLLWNGQATWQAAQWSVSGTDLDLPAGSSGSLTFTGSLPGVQLTRILTFRADTYLIEETVALANTGPAQVQGKLASVLAAPNLTGKDDKYNPTKVAYYAKGLKEKDDPADLPKFLKDAPPVQWGGVMSNYFLLAVAPEGEPGALSASHADDTYLLTVERNTLVLDPGVQTTVKTAYYLGPKEDAFLSAAPSNLGEAVDYGMFSFIARPLLLALNALYRLVGNYGLAIILLTIGIKILLWPLSQKSYKSMEQMRKIQPMMTKIREKYKDDRERMNQEMMQLYKTYNVNPAGGCFPMLLQIPVFFGLYQALLNSIELRHAPFIRTLPFTDLPWLVDLSAKDPYYITPLIMGATMLLQQKMTPAPGDPTQAKIMMFMPVVFTFMFLSFPSGLVVYWLVNNVLSIAQQWWMMRPKTAPVGRA